MVTAELVEYIKAQMSLHKTVGEVMVNLQSNGWSEGDIQAAFEQAGVKMKSIQTTTAHPTYSNQSETMSLVDEKLDEQKSQRWFDLKGLQWHEGLALLPAFIMFTDGGLLGAIIGILGWGVVIKWVRSPRISRPWKVVGGIGLTVGYVLVYLILGIMIVGAFG